MRQWIRCIAGKTWRDPMTSGQQLQSSSSSRSKCHDFSLRSRRSPHPRGVMKILLVEDTVGEPISKVLQRWGHEVLLAGASDEARATLASNKVDLMLVDRMLPRESGVDFVKHLQAEGGRPAPVIMISGRMRLRMWSPYTTRVPTAIWPNLLQHHSSEKRSMSACSNGRSRRPCIRQSTRSSTVVPNSRNVGKTR
jgi:hypothetical protein